MDDITFESKEDLYKRLLPALKTKKKELVRLGVVNAREEDIWNYLGQSKWIRSKNLSLYEMVSDILNSDNLMLTKYIEKMNLKRGNLRDRSLYEEEEKK